MELLIEEVRSRPVIWDCTIEVYRDVRLKDKAWDEVAEQLLKDKNLLRQQWKKLRDCHRQAINRRKMSTGQTATKIKKWKYEDQMTFLLNTKVHRPSDTNIPVPDNTDDQIPNEEEQVLTEVQEDVDDETESLDDVIESGNSQSTSSAKERRNRSLRGVDKVLKFLTTKEKNKASRCKRVPDDIDLFFASAAQSVRKLPRRLQNRIKIEVLNSISRAEDEHDWKNNSASSTPSHELFAQTPSPSSTVTSAFRSHSHYSSTSTDIQTIPTASHMPEGYDPSLS